MSRWVSPDAYERGRYAAVYAALRHWMTTDFPFWKAHFSNVEIPSSAAPEPDGPPAQ